MVEINEDKIELLQEDDIKEPLLQLIEKKVSELGERCKDVLVSFYYEKMTTVQIADVFDSSSSKIA